MNTFNITRALDVLKWDFSTNKRTYTLLMVGLFAYFFLIFVGGELFTIYNYSVGEQISSEIPITIAFSFMSYVLFGVIIASTVLAPMKSKSSKIAFMMLPSSKIERYVERVVLVAVLAPLYMLACMFVAELFRFLVSSIFIPSSMVTLNFSEILTDGLFSSPFSKVVSGETTFFAVLAAIMYYISNSCWFILGGTIWQKHPFLKTFIATVIIAVVFTIIFVVVGTVLDFNLAGTIEHTAKGSVVSNINIGYSIYGIVLSIACIIISYKKYMRIQVND